MAKRRRLEAPSAEQLRRVEEGLGQNESRSTLPPIASVAGEAAALTALGAAGQRAEQARDTADAERYRAALDAGLVVQQIALADVVDDALLRDRIAAGDTEMAELKASIAAHGLRLPIEVFARTGDGGGYGLISGWRRLMALRALHAETGEARFAHAPALLRAPDTASDAYVAMVEENEIRADLSHYERGRIAVLATEQGAFDSVESAVDGLFHAGSKAKRSKIRSFAEVHRALGAQLSFPSALTERQGLRLVAALRAGFAKKLHTALDQAPSKDAAAEWATLETLVKAAETKERNQPRTKGGRPPREAQVGSVTLSNGITLRRQSDAKGHVIRIEGKQVNSDMLDDIITQIKRQLDPG